MRRLYADMHGQVLAPAIPDCHATTRLERQVGLAMLTEPALDEAVGGGEPLLHMAGREGLPRDPIARQRVVNQYRPVGGRGHVGDRNQRLIVDLYRFESICGGAR